MAPQLTQTEIQLAAEVTQTAVQISNQSFFTALIAWGSIFTLIATVCLFLTRKFNKTRRIWMTCMLVTCYLLLAFDACAYYFRGDLRTVGYYMVRISNCAVFLLSDVILFFFNGYVACNLFGKAFLKDKENIFLAVRLYAVYAVAVIGMILVIVSQFTGLYYTIDEFNLYQRSDLFFISLLLPALGMLIDLSIVIQYRKNISNEILASLLLYLILPLIAECIQIFWYGPSLINVAICIAVMIMFAFAIIDQNKVLTIKEREASELKSLLKSAIDEKERCYSAVAQIYLSMHLIDVKTGSFKTIKSAESIEKNKYPERSDYFPVQIKNVMEKLATERFKKAVLYFTDISTLNKRLAEKDVIEHVFLGTASGWCRESFIRVDNDEDGNPKHVLYCVEVIDEAKRKENYLQHLAETDIMTGLINRGTGEKRIKELLNKNVYGLFCLIDCDKFKEINDEFGHSVGDKVIVNIAKCLKKSCKDKDIVFRLGGDEFAVYMPGLVTKTAAENFFKRFFDNLAKIKIPELEDKKISVSMGADFFMGKKISFDNLYRNADMAMYESKKVAGCKGTLYKEDVTQ
ncbi:MAG: GGDEF domain-containing protein [Candidatus Coproplasma sp.]